MAAATLAAVTPVVVIPAAAIPAVLYFGDMDGSGRPDLIEAKCKSDDKMLPVRGRSCSSGAMPFIRQEFGTFREFASADLGGIYGESKLASAAEWCAAFSMSKKFQGSRPW